MPPADSAALIVARFLKANRYEEVRFQHVFLSKDPPRLTCR